MKVYFGGCHCGAVRFQVRVSQLHALECNCSICILSGYQHVIVEASDFELLGGTDALTSYQFNTGVAQHTFCGRCGIKSFYTPRSHPNGISVNLRCLEGVEEGAFEIRPFDGANWEDQVHTIR